MKFETYFFYRFTLKYSQQLDGVRVQRIFFAQQHTISRIGSEIRSFVLFLLRVYPNKTFSERDVARSPTECEPRTFQNDHFCPSTFLVTHVNLCVDRPPRRHVLSAACPHPADSTRQVKRRRPLPAGGHRPPSPLASSAGNRILSSFPLTTSKGLVYIFTCKSHKHKKKHHIEYFDTCIKY